MTSLASLPWSHRDEAVPGLSVEQQVAWQRLVRLCEREDTQGLEQLSNFGMTTGYGACYMSLGYDGNLMAACLCAVTSARLLHFRVQASTSLPTIA